jgi:beta-fructofuranosidase
MVSGESATDEFEVPPWPENPPPGWVTYHLAHPGPGAVGVWDTDPVFFWKGRYHLFYLFPGREAFAFAHVSSTDMVHWRWHPTTLTPSRMGHGMSDGTGFFTTEGRPVMIYHGADGFQPGLTNQITYAEDDLLEEWSAPVAIESRVRPDQDASVIANWDPDGWLEGDTYYALFASLPPGVFAGVSDRVTVPTLHRSRDLTSWDYVGPFLSGDLPEAADDSDISGPNFFPIGDKHMLLCISHNRGSRYYLGEWKDERFTPDFHSRMNWHGLDIYEAETVLTPDGRRVMWGYCWFELSRDAEGQAVLDAASSGVPQRGIQTLPRELSLPDDGVLRMKPLRELEALRSDELRREGILVSDGAPVLLDGVAGDAVELAVTIRPGRADRAGIDVHCDATGHGGIGIVVDRRAGTLEFGEVVAPLRVDDDEDLLLRVFIDRHVIEVFANDRQAIVASHPADPSSVHMALTAGGGDIDADVTAWTMTSIYPGRAT